MKTLLRPILKRGDIISFAGTEATVVNDDRNYSDQDYSISVSFNGATDNWAWEAQSGMCCVIVCRAESINPRVVSLHDGRYIVNDVCEPSIPIESGRTATEQVVHLIDQNSIIMEELKSEQEFLRRVLNELRDAKLTG